MLFDEKNVNPSWLSMFLAFCCGVSITAGFFTARRVPTASDYQQGFVDGYQDREKSLEAEVAPYLRIIDQLSRELDQLKTN